MNRKRVQMLRDMIAGIPDEQINLAYAYSDEDGAPLQEWPAKVSCGTIACMYGFARLYPPFIKEGIPLTSAGEAAAFFGVPWETFFLFGERGADKEIALRRLDKLLKE